VIQRGVERPILEKERKFVIRQYVVTVLRPAPKIEDRLLEVYLSKYECIRPNGAKWDVSKATDEAVSSAHPTGAYCRWSDGASDGKGQPWGLDQKIWEDKVFPEMCELTAKAYSAFHFTPEKQQNGAAFKGFHSHWKNIPDCKTKVPAPDQCEYAVSGIDFLVDEDEKTWMLEVYYHHH